MREFTVDDVGAVFTCCLFPAFTQRALASVLDTYPEIEQAVVVVDGCRVGPAHEAERAAELVALEQECHERQAYIVPNETRIGTGCSIDRGLRALDCPLFLTVDHGVEVTRGIVELLVEEMNRHPEAVGAGRIRSDKACNKAFGPYIDPVFALWDREFIASHDELTFALTHVRIGDWQVDGCSTAQFLQYRALRLGATLAFVQPKMLYQYVRHHRTPHTRGRCASPHELMDVDEDYLIPRRRGRDGELLYQGGWRA